MLYHMTLDELVDFDIEVREIEDIIDKTSDELQKKIDWTKLWAKKYPVLATYQQEVPVDGYAAKLREMIDRLKQEQGYNDEDAFLVLKDILAQLFTSNTHTGA